MSAAVALGVWLGLAAVSFVALFFVAAPYGRHAEGFRGATVESRAGWFAMELPALLSFTLCFALGPYRQGAAAAIALALWLAHYVHRALVYPFRLRDPRRPMALYVVVMAFCFNCVNGTLNGRYLFARPGGTDSAWLRSPRFWIGCALFVAGWAVNLWSDETLRRLRQPGETGYRVPRGGLFRWISCPNYLGEGIEWTGWALLTGSPAGVAFALWTWANLVPRARANHRWYRARFADYPPERKALLPGIW